LRGFNDFHDETAILQEVLQKSAEKFAAEEVCFSEGCYHQRGTVHVCFEVFKNVLHFGEWMAGSGQLERGSCHGMNNVNLSKGTRR